jgi:hypothetical protein
LLITTCAHFKPARFQALDADVTVTVCSAVAAETVAYGM